MKKIISILSIFAFVAHDGWATEPGNNNKKSCTWDGEELETYVPEYADELSEATDQLGGDLVGTVTLVPQMIAQMLAHALKSDVLLSVLVQKAIDERVEETKQWLQNSAASNLASSILSNVSSELQKDVKKKTFKVAGMGVYSFCEGEFSDGSWDGADMVLREDTGAGCLLKGEAEFNVVGVSV